LVALPFRLHLLTIVVGALSFLVPMAWVVLQWMRPSRAGVQSEEPARRSAATKPRTKKAAKKPAPANPTDPERRWHLSVFRCLLFGAFTWLSWLATRNSHQFAAVVGTVTAWNFAEWAGAVRRSREERRGADKGAAPVRSREVLPRVVALVAVGLVFAWVASGRFYEAAREGRTIGLGEQPLWYPHEAVKFAGEPGMPERFLSYHIGHASLYEYDFAPERKVYVDARLEVIGPDLFERYMELQNRITTDKPGWTRELDEMGRPAVLVDLENNTGVMAGLMSNPSWKCVWFDPVAAVFVHESYSQVVSANEVNFLARHFRPDPRFDPSGPGDLLAITKGLSKLASMAQASPSRGKPLMLLGSGYARRLREAEPSNANGWKQTGVLEMLREPGSMPGDPNSSPVARFRMAFDPVFDLSLVRATYALRRAAELAPNDFTTHLLLKTIFEFRKMAEAELPPLDRLVELTPINAIQRQNQAMAEEMRRSIRSELGPPPPTRWENLTDLARIVNELLASGRAETAADYLEQAEPADTRSWAETDRIATLRLHLGQAERARTLWQNAASPPKVGLRESRIGFARMAEGSLDAARESFRAALAADPKQFDAYYGLAVLELDLGHAPEALAAAEMAATLAPHDTARTTAREIAGLAQPYAQAPTTERKDER
jgi:tetratricopeptide (TPR) repeat protein